MNIIISIMDKFVSFQSSYVEAPPHSVIVLGDRGFKVAIKAKGGHESGDSDRIIRRRRNARAHALSPCTQDM